MAERDDSLLNLIDKARNGGRKAFNTLWRRLGPDVGIAVSRIHSCTEGKNRVEDQARTAARLSAQIRRELWAQRRWWDKRDFVRQTLRNIVDGALAYELVLRWRNDKDEAAFGCLYERFDGIIAARVAGLFKKYYLPFDSAAVRTIVGDAWMKILKDFDPKRGKFVPFMLMVARNATVDYIHVPQPPRIEGRASLTRVNSVPPEVYEELLRITFSGSSEPHQLIVYIGKLLSYAPKDIVARLSERPLRALSEELIEHYILASTLAKERITELFGPLRRSLKSGVGDKWLRHYYGKNPEASVSNWTHRVEQRVKLKCIIQGEKDYLKTVFGVEDPPHPLVEFGFSQLLRQTPQFIDQLFDFPLDDEEARFEDDYMQGSFAGEETGVRNCFRKLRQRLTWKLARVVDPSDIKRLNPVILPFKSGRTTFRDYYGSASGELLRTKRKHILERVRKALYGQGKGLPFAYIRKYF